MPMWAIGLSAAAGAGGSIFSGLMGASGADKSASAIRYAADKASQTALTLNDRSRQDLAPFQQLGKQTAGQLSDMFSGKSSLSDLFKSSDLYTFESQQGTLALNQQLAARGQFGSGAGMKSLALFDQSLVAQEGDSYFNKLFGTTQLGEAAGAQQANNTTMTGNTVAGIQANAGAQIGQAYQNQYSAYGAAGAGGLDAIGGGLNNYVQYGLYKPFLNSLAGNGSRSGSDFGFGANQVTPEQQRESLSVFSGKG